MSEYKKLFERAYAVPVPKIVHEIDFAEIEKQIQLFGEVFTESSQCACSHLTWHHTKIGPKWEGIPTRSACVGCDCKFYEPDNLEWLVKNKGDNS